MVKKFLSVFVVLVAVFSSNSVKAQLADPDLVKVYEWYNQVDQEYVILAEGEIQEGQLLQYKYRDKRFLFYGYRTPGENRVPVYRWWNPVTKDQLSIAEDEFKDADMIQQGYTNKSLQFYAPIRRADNHIAIYRWYKESRKDWVCVPESGNTDKLWKKGFRNKSFQFYGVLRNEFENQ